MKLGTFWIGMLGVGLVACGGPPWRVVEIRARRWAP